MLVILEKFYIASWIYQTYGVENGNRSSYLHVYKPMFCIKLYKSFTNPQKIISPSKDHITLGLIYKGMFFTGWINRPIPFTNMQIYIVKFLQYWPYYFI